MTKPYFQGYNLRENLRLQDQASTLAKLLRSDTLYPSISRVLKVGCGIFTGLSFMLCVFAWCGSSNGQNQSTPSQSALAQLPFAPKPREPIDYNQRFGRPVKINASRKFTVLAGETHKSKNNVVAVYIGLPVVDSSQKGVIIKAVKSKMANPANIVFSPLGDSLLVEYFNVPPGFQDEITLEFSVDIFERRAKGDVKRIRPYDKNGHIYKKYVNHGNDPEAMKCIKEASVQENDNPIAKAGKIYSYLGLKLSYGKPTDILGVKNAHCGIYTNLFVRLCQSAGVPTRRCAGFSLSANPQEKSKTQVFGHNWAEFYVEGIGWIPVDPTMGDKKDQRQEYYFGAVDSGRLCISKSGFHDQLPLWHKKSADGAMIYTDNVSGVKGFRHPATIQGVLCFQHGYDVPTAVSVSDPYGPSLTVLSRNGNIIKP